MRRFLTSVIMSTLAVSAWAQSDAVQGQVRNIDKTHSRITIKHGEIKNLDIPAMTMKFHVRDASLLDRVSEGDKVRFTAEKINGEITVTSLQKAN